MVFAILAALSQILLWLGSWLGPKPKPAKTSQPVPAQNGASVSLQRDAAIIAALVADLGHTGSIKIKRVTQ